jgi:hypothetical protein
MLLRSESRHKRVILLRRAPDASEITRQVARHGLTTSLSHQTLLSLVRHAELASEGHRGRFDLADITRVDRGQLEGRRGCEGGYILTGDDVPLAAAGYGVDSRRFVI